jgi:hypothetical protein
VTIPAITRNTATMYSSMVMVLSLPDAYVPCRSVTMSKPASSSRGTRQRSICSR